MLKVSENKDTSEDIELSYRRTKADFFKFSSLPNLEIFT